MTNFGIREGSKRRLPSGSAEDVAGVLPFGVVGVWEVGREIIVDWAWREPVEIASRRPMRVLYFRFLVCFSWIWSGS